MYLINLTRWTKINSLSCPIKMLHGKKDNIINISHSEQLYEKSSNKSIEPTWFENIDNGKNILDAIKKEHYSEIINYEFPKNNNSYWFSS